MSSRFSRRTNDLSQSDSWSSSSFGRARMVPRTIEDDESRRLDTATLTGSLDWSDKGSTSSIASQREEKQPIEIDTTQDTIRSAAFLVYVEHLVSGGEGGKLRCWRVDDGQEQDPPMNAEDPICNVAVSQGGKWIVSGTKGGRVAVWNATSYEKAIDFKGHDDAVYAVDIWQDPTRIRVATGSKDGTARVWFFRDITESSLNDPENLYDPLKHKGFLAAVKFSPDDGQYLATATWIHDSVRIYNVKDGSPVVEVPIFVNSPRNQSLLWADNKQLFVLSRDGSINHLHVSARTPLYRWSIHSKKEPRCIALASNGQIIAASANSSVSFWDTRGHRQVGPVIESKHDIWTMAVSNNYDIMTAGNQKITIRNLCDVLPSPYREQMLQNQQIDKTDRDLIVEALRSRNARLDEIITDHDKQIQDLRNKLGTTQRTTKQETDGLNETIRSLRSELRIIEEGLNRKALLVEEKSLQIEAEILNTRRVADQQKNNLQQTIGSLRMNINTQKTESDRRIANLEQDIVKAGTDLKDSEGEEEDLLQLVRAHELKHKCKTLFEEGRISDAARSLLKIMDTLTNSKRSDMFKPVDWLPTFAAKCVSELIKTGDKASKAEKYVEATEAYSTALLLSPIDPGVLNKWASIMMRHRTVDEALRATTEHQLKTPRVVVCRTICDILEATDRIAEAMDCLREMQRYKQQDERSAHDEQLQWELDFRSRCMRKLEAQGDSAMDSKKHEKAIEYYADALYVEPGNIGGILVKCCMARAHLLKEALAGATKYIKLHPSSYKGYKRKYAALHGMRLYKEAFEAFTTMLAKMKISPDPQVRELHGHYVDITFQIGGLIEKTTRDIPLVFIDVTTGQLADKDRQKKAFEELPIYDQLRSSMTTPDQLDRPRIRREVEKFYQYVMFSHRWQPNEPMFQAVQAVAATETNLESSVYGLPESPTNYKLRKFCELVRSRGFRWGWSDTCCINQADKTIQQESIVSMFRWYRSSSLTLVHLLGVLAASQKPGSLWGSIWNTRGWTYQEYIASEVVQFYTEDWQPYLGLDMFNHKLSSVILSEMEHAMNFGSEELRKLQPGIERVREKLYLASARQTTREEDIAYSLFGIFDLALPVIYGEGSQALRRFLEQILIRSGDVTLLAWTGTAGGHDSYLPSNLSVYNQIVPPHTPQPIGTIEMDSAVVALRTSLPDLSLAVRLYERLQSLPRPSTVAGGLRLPGITFPLTGLHRLSGPDSGSDVYTYRATTRLLGDVQVKTKENLSAPGLRLIHPWISPLLDPDFSSGVPLYDDLETRALRLAVRLRREFGALLLAAQGRTQYKRVAADAFITVQIGEGAPLDELIRAIDDNINVQ